jgi:hypothetical protein
MQQTKSLLIIYNANTPKEKFTCLKVDEPGMQSVNLNTDQMEIVQATCGDGPYLAFFREWPNTFYTLHRRYNSETKALEHVEVVQNSILYDDKQAEIVATILRKLTAKSIKQKK